MDILDEIFTDLHRDVYDTDTKNELALKRAKARVKGLVDNMMAEKEAEQEILDDLYEVIPENSFKVRLGTTEAKRSSRFDSRPPEEVKLSSGSLDTHKGIL